MIIILIPQFIIDEIQTYSEFHLWGLLSEMSDFALEDKQSFYGTSCTTDFDEFITSLKKLELIDLMQYILDEIRSKN